MLRRLLLGVMLGPATAGCSSTAAPVTLEMLTWWSEPGEKQALQLLVDSHKKRHPNVTVSITDADSPEKAFEGLDTRFELGVPPDTYQVNGGAKLLSRVVDPLVDGLPTTTPSLKPVTDIIEQAKDVKILDALTALIDVGGEQYGVPVNVHRINNLYYAPSKLKGKQPPSDLDGFIRLVRDLSDKDANGDPIPGRGALGIGIADTWTVEALVFENLFPSVAIKRADLLPAEATRLGFFGEFWSGKRDDLANPIDRQIIEETLVTAQELWPYVKTFDVGDTNDGLGDWADPFIELADGNSSVAFVVMGDWATGYLKNLEIPKYQGVDFEVVPFPGTDRLFIYTTDVLTLTANSKQPDEVRDFLGTALAVNTQIAFSEQKGSIPAIDLEEATVRGLSQSQRTTLSWFKDKDIVKVPAMSGLFTADIPPKLLRDGLCRMLLQSGKLSPLEAANSRDAMHQTLRNYYWMLSYWNEKLQAARSRNAQP